MPSTSPGSSDTPSTFAHIFPGAPTESLQATATFVYRFKRYVAYISGKQLNILSGPSTLVQALTFKHDLVALAVDTTTGKVSVASQDEAWILEPLTEGWTKVWWEKSLLLRLEDTSDVVQWLSWGNEGELLVAGSHALTMFSTGPASRTTSPRASAIDGDTTEERRALWSKLVASPVRQAEFSPSSSLIATCSRYDRLVKIWRRLSFEEALFDHTYLPHPATVTHLQWRPMNDTSEERRTSGISRRHDEEPELLYTIANDGILRVWRTGSTHDLDILVLHTSLDLVAAIPDSPSVTAKGVTSTAKPARYAVMIPADAFTAAVNAAIGISINGKISHSKEFLKEMVSRDLDVVVAFDGHGRMSAWGLQSIGHKRRPDTEIQLQPLHIAHAEGLSLKLQPHCPAILTCWFQDEKLHLLSHAFSDTGEIAWWQGTGESFFSPSAPGAARLSRASSWRGAAWSEWAVKEPQLAIDICAISTKDDDDVLHAVPVSSPFDPSQNCIVSITKSGIVVCSLMSRDGDVKDASLDHIATFESGVAEAADFAASTEFAAVISQDSKSLAILDLTDGYVEHQQRLHECATHIKCFTPSSRQNYLAVGYQTAVDVLVQGRYEAHIWQNVKRVSITGLGLQLEHLAWRQNGGLALSAGNGLFIDEPQVELKHLDLVTQQRIGIAAGHKVVLSEVAVQAQKPLPVWHPVLLADMVRHGHYKAAATLIVKLDRKLRFYSSGDDLSPTLDENLNSLIHESRTSGFRFDGETARDIKEMLDEKELPLIDQAEQHQLGHVISTLLYIQEHVSGLDSNALRYLFEWKLQLIQHETSVQNGTPQPDGVAHHEFVPEMQWREITLAYHSTTQQPLIDILILHHDNKMTWQAARLLGVTSWVKDRQALEAIFEQLGQTSYRSSQPPDPVNASIYYLAMHRKATLVALWRIATWHREQRTTTNFLKRDFTQPEAKTAAKKNAYALMGKRRFQYSAAFFLLADDAPSAINVLAGQCEDIGFAIAVARLYCGDGSRALRQLLVDRIIPQAKQDGDRWLLSWCHSVFHEAEKAANSLIEPSSGVRTWTQDDPTTLLLYRQLRWMPSEHEYNAVLKAARVLRRMGEWLLALDLVRTWPFKPAQAQRLNASNAESDSRTNGFHGTLPGRKSPPQAAEPPSLLDTYVESKPAQPIDEKAAREAKAAELLAKLKAKKEVASSSSPPTGKKKPEPTQFKEPDANSLLDAFGF